MSLKLNAALKKDYEDLFDSCLITPARKPAVEALVGKIVGNRARYEAVETTTGVPWYVVGVIHNMESSLSFKKHLHNGDPLSARTVHVPKGRPKTGKPPFTWEESAADALHFDNLAAVTQWTLANLLFRLEGFNGFGYLLHHPDVKSPYLWSFSNHYTKGKYTADGKFDHNAGSSQCGAAVLLHLMSFEKTIDIPR